MNAVDKTLELLMASGIKTLSDEPLSSHSTFRIGGRARLAAFPDTADRIVAAVNIATLTGIRFIVVGNGSNILFADEGFDGLVIFSVACNSVRIENETVTADCGVSFTKLSLMARDSGLSGLEFAYGIPGTVGGAVYMNAGAYGGEVCQVLNKVTAFDRITGEIRVVDNENCCFGYRTSVFTENENLTVLSAEYKLTLSEISGISDKMNDYMSRRRDKQPLEFPSAGSTFKRPEGYFAGKLIEDAGLKSYTVGGAQVSEKHAGFVINRGNATANDVLNLVEYVRAEIKSKFGVTLECEIKYIK